MSGKIKLASEERKFFNLVMQAILANPFSDERADIDLKIAGLFPDISRDIILEKTIQEVRIRVRKLEKDGRDDFNLFREPDRSIIQAAFIFNFFHFYCDHFDRIIKDQVIKDQIIENQVNEKSKPERMSGDITVQVEFSGEAIAHLEDKGFTHKEALHFFALSYQLRRAYYFIDKGLIGRSLCMKKFRESLWNNVFTSDLQLYNRYLWDHMEDFSTMIIGETGAGKGAAANAIGRSGFIPFNEKKRCFTESFTRSFVSLNLSQFSENLIESELFGHKKGSFTGAVDDHDGVFSRCSPHGAIFLDEIGEVSYPIQIKLLKVLEERAFTPVGSRETRKFKGRIIAATNRTLAEIHNPDILREDFYYRLCSDIIIVPPLRQRIKEEPLELDDLVHKIVEKVLGISSSPNVRNVSRILHQQLGIHYDWPGNVRELEQYTRRIMLNRKCRIEFKNDNSYKKFMKDTRTGMAQNAGTDLAEEFHKGQINAQDLVKGYCSMLYDRFGNYGEAARRSGLDRRTVKKYVDEWDEKIIG